MVDSAGSAIQRDFDTIALLSDDGWDHNSHYHAFLLRQLPRRVGPALDIGCGTGAFSRLLARRADRVLALDLSPQMIRIARERSSAYANISFEVTDAMKRDLSIEEYDCIASIATLHHLPLGDMLQKMKAALRIGGVLLALDLYDAAGVSDLVLALPGVPVSAVLRLLKTRRLRSSRELREAWAEHSRHDTYLTLPEIRETCESILPGARVRRHVLWRYSVTWTKG